MQLLYPSSFLKLILAGFALAVLPLIFALVNNAYSIHQLANHSQRAVYQAVRVTQSTRLLIEQVNSMERSIRQFSIIGDPSLLEGYTNAHKRFIETAQSMSALKLNPEHKESVTKLLNQELSLHERIRHSDGKAALLRRDRPAG